MSVTLGQVLTSVYRRMGSKPSDPEYPRDQLVLYVNLAVGELHGDCARIAGGDVLLVRGRAIEATADRTYALAEQSPAIASVTQIRRVRLTGRDQVRLRPVTAESLDLEEGYAYATTGPDSAVVLYTSDGVAVRASLTIDYTEGPALLSADNDTLPAWLPDQYRDVVELMVVESALPQGGESGITQAQLAKLQDRRAQLWTHWSTRAPGPVMRRD